MSRVRNSQLGTVRDCGDDEADTPTNDATWWLQNAFQPEMMASEIVPEEFILFISTNNNNRL